MSTSPRVIASQDDEFPDVLREVDPVVERLWAIGRDLRELGPMVAVVGTRTPTPYGVEAAFGLASDLASSGVCVVSGMARGIDAAAHEGALAADGATVAVLGSGVDVAYPRQNRELYRKIARRGTLISEQPPAAPPYPNNFLLRNRIIAGMTLGTVIVQASDRGSGAMNTARHALDQGAELFAVPGDIHAAASWGPNDLIRQGHARICTGVGDIQEQLGERLGWTRTAGDWLDPPDLEPNEKLVLDLLTQGAARAERVAGLTSLDASACNRALSSLELLGVVARSASGIYRRAR